MEEKIKILLCEDDENLGMLLREYLQAKGFTTVLCPDGEVGYKEFNKNKFDIAVLDVMMPKKDGFTLAQEIRQTNADLPIIFLTAKTLKEDILEGFKIGADDYITKPFELQVLQAKIQALLRRTYDFNGKLEILEHKGLRFIIEENMVLYQDKKIELSKNEAKILHILLEKKNTIVSREEMMNYLWKTDFYVDENTLSVNVNRLRKKLESVGCTHYIETKKGLGYKI